MASTAASSMANPPSTLTSTQRPPEIGTSTENQSSRQEGVNSAASSSNPPTYDSAAATATANPTLLASTTTTSAVMPPFPTNDSDTVSRRLSQKPSQNPRSCTTCRRKKVRCDKRHPCSNCTRTGAECIYPGPGRAPRRVRKPPDSELLARLRKLESVVKGLGAAVEDEPTKETEMVNNRDNETQGSVQDLEMETVKMAPDTGLTLDGTKIKAQNVSHQYGQLATQEGRSRYVSNSVWSRLGDQVAQIRDLLDDESSEEEVASPENSEFSGAPCFQGFIFGHSGADTSLGYLHPPLSQMIIILEVFKDHVDPVAKVFHRSTMRFLVSDLLEEPRNPDRNTEAVLFSVCYASVTSLSDKQCRSYFDENKTRLLSKYRYAVEQALGRANLLTSNSVVLLQALVMYLLAVRRHDDSRFCWTLCALAIRLAQALGIHRDGAQFGLSPLETEIRRRLWWQICSLDIRASEDHGCEPSLNEHFYDTKMPLNIQDDDITADMKEPPEERVGCTEMTLSLIRFEIGLTVRRLASIPATKLPGRPSGLELRKKVAENLVKHIEDRYLQNCDLTVPIQFVTFYVTKLVMAKMWLCVHQHELQKDSEKEIPLEVHDRFFETSLQVIEYSRILEDRTDTLQWNWLFRTYMQWHPLMYLLSDLGVRSPGPLASRAWKNIDAVYERWGLNKPRKTMFWKPMRRLLARALITRAKYDEYGARMFMQHMDPRSPMDSAHTATPQTPNAFGSDRGKAASPHTQDSESSTSQGDRDLDMNLLGRLSQGVPNDASAQTPGNGLGLDTSYPAEPSITTPAMNWSETTFELNPFSFSADAPAPPASLFSPSPHDFNPAGQPSNAYVDSPWFTWDEVVRDYMAQERDGPGSNVSRSFDSNPVANLTDIISDDAMGMGLGMGFGYINHTNPGPRGPGDRGAPGGNGFTIKIITMTWAPQLSSCLFGASWAS